MAWLDKNGDGMQTDEMKAFYCISTDIEQTVFALWHNISYVSVSLQTTQSTTAWQKILFNQNQVDASHTFSLYFRPKESFSDLISSINSND